MNSLQIYETPVYPTKEIYQPPIFIDKTRVCKAKNEATTSVIASMIMDLLTITSLDFLDQIDDGGEVVAVAVEEHTTRVGSHGISLPVAFNGLEEIAVEHFGPRESELGFFLAVVVLQEVLCHHNLVKQVPLSPVGQCADALVE